MFKVTLDREEPRSSKLIINPQKIAHIFLHIFCIISAYLSQFFTNTTKTNTFPLWKITLETYWDQFLLPLSYV